MTAQLPLDFQAALRKGAEALARIERVTSDDFRERAASRICAVLRQRGPSSGEVLVMECKGAGIVPTDDRHFGPVFRRLVRERSIHCVGFVPRMRGHGSAGGRVWALVG